MPVALLSPLPIRSTTVGTKANMESDEGALDSSVNVRNVTMVQLTVANAFDREDPQALLKWAQRALPVGFADVLDHPDPAVNARAAYWFARALWDATPLASNSFLPKPLPAPERNAPCPCGSGALHSACCVRLQNSDPPSPEDVWSILATTQSDAYWLRAEKAGQLPIFGALCIAAAWHDSERWQPLRKFAEARLATCQDCTPKDVGFLLDWLCDAYDNLHRTPRKKLALLTRFAEDEAPAVRAVANRRLATIWMDAGEEHAAQAAALEVQRDEPESFETALFEVTMLIGAKEWERASERAAHWRAHFHDRDDATEDGLDLLGALAKDSQRTFEVLSVRDAPPEVLALLDWIDRNADRPLPRLRWKALEDAADDATLRDAYQPVTGRNRRKFEDEWRTASGMEKPFGIQPFSGFEDECWDRRDAWVDWLRGHTQALDSMTILDDLATLLDSARHQIGVRNHWRDALLERGLAIIEKHWPPERAGKLPWVLEANRPALRLLAAFIDNGADDWEDGRTESAIRLYLRLNPNDNHGVRCHLVDQLVTVGRDAEALACAERYPNDMFAETRYGAVLALYRLGRLDEAEAHLAEALADLPLVSKYLLRDRVARPKSGEHGMTLGGEEQAWYYRDDMRDVWMKTDGALEWLAQRSKKRSVGA